MKRPELGQRVRASDRIARQFPSPLGDKEEKWMRSIEAYPWRKKPSPVEGIFAGYRTISDGRIEIVDCEFGVSEWHPTRHFECWLIIPSARQNPVRVFPEDVEVVK